MNGKLILTALAIFLMPQSDPITVPKVERKTQSYTSTVETVERTCPDGYEGHFVDPTLGFDNGYWLRRGIVIGPDSGYTICFRKDFMDKVRKNPDMLTVKPSPPRGA